MKICLECKKQFSRRKKESFKRWESRQYCSHECANKSPERISKCTKVLWRRKPPKSAFKKGQVPHNYKGGKERFPNCVDCNKKLSANNIRHCRKCAGVLFRGSAHPNWKGENRKKSDKKHLDSAYMAWMFAVKNRDNWKCRIGDKSCKGRMEAHHILSWREYPELRYQINNGITLCHAHHPLKRAEEKRLESYFMKLVSVSKEVN